MSEVQLVLMVSGIAHYLLFCWVISCLCSQTLVDTMVDTELYITASFTSPLLLVSSLWDLTERVHVAVHLL